MKASRPGGLPCLSSTVVRDSAIRMTKDRESASFNPAYVLRLRVFWGFSQGIREGFRQGFRQKGTTAPRTARLALSEPGEHHSQQILIYNMKRNKPAIKRTDTPPAFPVSYDFEGDCAQIPALRQFIASISATLGQNVIRLGQACQSRQRIS